jgi:hypothetical protein
LYAASLTFSTRFLADPIEGGLLGGEVGISAFNATGVIGTRDAPPTVGWGPSVLLLGTILGIGAYLNGGLQLEAGPPPPCAHTVPV